MPSLVQALTLKRMLKHTNLGPRPEVFSILNVKAVHLIFQTKKLEPYDRDSVIHNLLFQAHHKSGFGPLIAINEFKNSNYPALTLRMLSKRFYALFYHFLIDDFGMILMRYLEW